jgi:GDP-L-fucose synthase
LEKILVFGANSSVGKEFIALQNTQYIIKMDSKSCNLMNKNEVNSIIKRHSDVACVINLAAKVGGIFSNVKEPYDYLTQNIIMNSNIIDACRKYGIKNLLSLSSTCAYPDVLDDSLYPIKEESIHLGPPPISNMGYGYAKRVMQLQTELCNQQYGTNFSYFIPCNLYGPYSKFDDHAHFLGKLIRKIWEYNTGKIDKIEMNGGSTAKRQYLFTQDLANCIVWWLSKNYPITYTNIAPKETKTIREITDIALKVCECKANVKFLDESISGQIRRDVSSELYLKTNNIEFTSLANGIKTTYEQVLQQW